MKVIVYTNDDGGTSVVSPVYPPNLTPDQADQFLLWVKSKDVPPLPDGSPRPSFIKTVEESNKMGLFFEAWSLSKSGNLSLDRAKAENMKREQFRKLRKPLLEALDVQFMRSLEDGDTASTTSISAKKRKLRDVTLIDLSEYDTPEKLNAFIPEVLRNL